MLYSSKGHNRNLGTRLETIEISRAQHLEVSKLIITGNILFALCLRYQYQELNTWMFLSFLSLLEFYLPSVMDRTEISRAHYLDVFKNIGWELNL